MSMEWTKKRKKPEEDEEAKLNDALLEFQADFGQSSTSTQPKAFLRGNVVEGNKASSSGAEGSVYAPKFSLSMASKTSNVGSKDFDEAKKLAAAKARRMLEDAARAKNLKIVPKVVVPPTRPLQRPPKPGSLKAKQEKPKTSNLEMFKQELARVQEDREKRRDLRTHLESAGMDSSVVDRIAPAVDRPYHGNGEFDDDPYTTNIYVSNIPHNVTENDLLFTFGSFGPLAALKILYPRSDEERRRPHICAFVAYMCRVDVDRFMNEVRVIIVRNEPIKFAFARPVTIPPLPYYVPPQLLALQCPDSPSGLPFNAQPIKSKADSFLAKYKSFPPLNALPTSGHPAYEDYMNLIQNAFIRVVIPPDRQTLRLINRMAINVVTEGPHFEALICSQECHNPQFQFLWDNMSACHVYYRWRVFSLLQGDTIKEWRREKFRMFKNGSWWIPPFASKELNMQMPKSLYDTNCLLTYPERWMKVAGGGQRRGGEEEKKATDNGRGRRAKEVDDIKKKKEKKKLAKKERLSDKKRKKLEKIIREMTPEQTTIAEAMIWCVENATNAREISECLYESLTLDETPLHKKIARVYLINDILANCVQRNLRDVFLYRSHFDGYLEKIFVALHKTYKSIASRIKQEQFKQRVMHVFQHWEETALYPTDRMITCQNIFLGLVEIKEQVDSKMDEDDEDSEDLDGVPIGEIPCAPGPSKVYSDDDDIDGVPFDFGASKVVEKKQEEKKHVMKFAQNFKPITKEEKRTSSPLFSSKWDNTSPKDDEDEDIDGVEIADEVITIQDDSNQDDLSPGEIKEIEPLSRRSTSGVSSSALIDERRRKLMRDVEVRAMTMLDDLEAEKDPNAKRKVDEYRRIEMEKVERMLETEEEPKEERKKDRKEKKKEKKRDRSRSRSKERDRNRDRDRDRERRRDRDRSSERDRDRDRRYR